MASTKTRIKPIRIANETADFFEGKPLNRYVECLHRMMESGEVVMDGEEVKVPCGEVLREIGDYALMCNMTLEEMIVQFFNLMEDGSVVFENGRLEINK